MRLDARHIRPVHTVQIPQANRYARHRNIQREIIPHREFVVKRTEMHQPAPVALCQIVIRLTLMHRKEHPRKRNFSLITESQRKLFNLELINRHRRQVQIQVRFSRSRVVAVARIVNKPSAYPGGSAGQQFQSRQWRRKTVMIAQTIIDKARIFPCRACPVAGRAKFNRATQPV